MLICYPLHQHLRHPAIPALPSQHLRYYAMCVCPVGMSAAQEGTDDVGVSVGGCEVEPEESTMWVSIGVAERVCLVSSE
jgi:hypothetical protein